MKHGFSYFTGIGICLMSIASAATPPVASHEIVVEELRCELRENPIAIDTNVPRLGWRLKSDQLGTRQTAYQVLAATSPDTLSSATADLWNSGRCETSATLEIPYHGKPLRSNQQIFWTVRAWDQNNIPTPWASPAHWTTSLLTPSEWEASWIGSEPAADQTTRPIESAKWIWSPEELNSKEPDASPGDPPPGAVRYFRAKFHLPDDTKIQDTRIDLSVDNDADVYVNGQLIGHANDWAVVKQFYPAGALKPGKINILAVRVHNGGDKPNPAGLAATFQAPRESGDLTILATGDNHWQVSLAPDTNGWPLELLKNAKEPARWLTPRVIGDWDSEPWKTKGYGTAVTLPIFRKDFTIQKPVRRALIHICGLGQYALSLNGQTVGDHFLDPPWSKYEKTAYYNTFDITPMLSPNRNAIGVMLGKGFYNTAGDRRIFGVHTHRPLTLIAQLNLEFEDGSTTTIVTDTSWKWTRSPLTHNSILGGSDYDARLYQSGWDTPTFDDSNWRSAIRGTPPGGKLTAVSAPPMRTFQEFKPVGFNEPKPGHYVYDFGQNASAAVRLKVHGPTGSTVKLQWAEQRQGQSPHTNDGKGLVDQSGIGFGYLLYTLRGDKQDESWFTNLFYTGFQYLELTDGVPKGSPNPDNKPVVTEISSVNVHSDQPPAGTFICSNAMYNRIDQMVAWAVRSNLSHILTDCPQREKLGYLEVPWLMWGSIASRYRIDAFGEKITRDIRDSQLDNGKIYTVAPSFPHWKGGFQYTPEWGCAGVFIPWYLYEWYGDKQALEQNYHAMRAFTDYLTSTSTDLIPAPGLGDWYDYGHGEKLGPSRFTPTDLTATCIFAGCADIVTSSAGILGHKQDQEKYADLAAGIRKAFNEKFHTGFGKYKNSGSPQTAHSMALEFNMVPSNERPATAQAIVDDLKQRGWQQTSGDVGYRFLLNALADTGHSDAIFKILNRDQIGSYAFLVNAGWTSLPEAWNANHANSFNHCMLGHIQEWFSHHLLGIAQAPGSVGYKTIVIQPTPGDGVTSASGTFDSPRGKIDLQWEQKPNLFTCEFTIPANTNAIVRLPVPPGAHITINDEPITQQKETIKPLPREANREVFTIPSGHYSIQARYTQP